MDILKVGKLPGNENFRGKCTHCGCEVQCTKAETRASRDERDHGILFVDCPTEGCLKAISVEPWEIGRKKR